MKIRNGFVSNSSSSSFCILGFNADDIGVDINDIPRGTFIEEAWGISDYYEQKFIGCDPSSQKDDETLGHFKERIVEEINFHFGEGKAKVEDIRWYTDGGYDG